jgi:hypothetical protein
VTEIKFEACVLKAIEKWLMNQRALPRSRFYVSRFSQGRSNDTCVRLQYHLQFLACYCIVPRVLQNWKKRRHILLSQVPIVSIPQYVRLLWRRVNLLGIFRRPHAHTHRNDRLKICIIIIIHNIDSIEFFPCIWSWSGLLLLGNDLVSFFWKYNSTRCSLIIARFY